MGFDVAGSFGHEVVARVADVLVRVQPPVPAIKDEDDPLLALQIAQQLSGVPIIIEWLGQFRRIIQQALAGQKVIELLWIDVLSIFCFALFGCAFFCHHTFMITGPC